MTTPQERKAEACPLIKRCRMCEGGALDSVFEMEPMPLAGAFAATRKAALASPRYPLHWVQCRSCGLVQVVEEIPDETLFGEYRYSSSSVPGLVRHFDEFASELRRRFLSRARLRFLEVGCNDGILLTRLPREWELVGVDPSDVAFRATGGYDLYNEPFTREIGLTGFDVVSASNCLAHSSQMREMVLATHDALVDGGEFFVEVHDLEVTLETGQWDTVYHEHKAEFSLASLSRAICPVGFKLAGMSRLPLHGGLLRARFVKGEPTDVSPHPPARMQVLQKAYRERRESALYGQLSRRSPLIAYGASGRATVWFNQFPELEFACVVDDASLREGRFVPGVGVPIVSWDERPVSSACLITAWNYAAEIKAKRVDYDGHWLQAW